MSTEEFALNCTVRTDLGKGASRRLRRLNDNIPAVLYGGDKEPVSLTIAHKDIAKAIENEAFFAHIITLNIGSKKEKAVIKALQRHPARPIIMHADFLRVSDKQAIVVKVPIHFLNEEACVGVKLGGGNILKALNEIEVSCLPKDLPEFLEVDMLEIELGDSVHLSDITLPTGVTSVALSHGDSSDLSVATVAAPKAIVEDEALPGSLEAAADSAASADDSASSDDSSGDGE
ncbi:MAG: 50S ribosomal protein L25/general stress protein Ctc [SAR86 cluster bacterium]|uniref:Large ribosomal subunit protein bL25 n=1 Tax=SAR86 cluster bacterium TaxID=2030880 RepID=A0A2A5B3T0_9GAMM|nr:MAG: 50S ribosomal protein L25/general stress protein Ctc [SAR86 cluster bacterium]